MVRQPKGLRLSVGAGLLVGTAVALVILLVLIVDELNALGTTGV
jgi:hypothetical protein